MGVAVVHDICPMCGGQRIGFKAIDLYPIYCHCKNPQCLFSTVPIPYSIKKKEEILTYLGYISDDKIYWINPEIFRRAKIRFGYGDFSRALCFLNSDMLYSDGRYEV